MLLLLLLWLLFTVVVVAVVEATTVFCFLAMQADVLFLTFVPFAEKNVVSLSSEIVSSSSSSTTLMSTSRGEKGSSLIVVDSKKEELRRFWLEKKNSNDVTGLKIWQQKVFNIECLDSLSQFYQPNGAKHKCATTQTLVQSVLPAKMCSTLPVHKTRDNSQLLC